MNNPMLTWYAAEVLDQIPARLGLDPVYEIAADLTFRDEQGAWWRPQRDESWIRHRDGVWERADRPITLEGVTPLPVGIATSAAGLDEGIEPGTPTGPADALERAVARIVEMYRTGVMVSTMAELALSDSKLIAEDGSLWTVGARSRSWYRYGDGAWDDGYGLPERFLSGDDARSAAESDESPLQRWVENGPLLPELVAAPWTVPDPPDALVGEAPTDVPAPPPPPPITPTWTPTHTVPPEGLQAWAQPDPAGAVVANLPGGVELRVEERRADWAHVAARNGWQGWVDGRRLVAAQATVPPPWSVGAAAPAAESVVSTRAASLSLRSVAAVAVAVTIFLPWFRYGYFGAGDATDVPAAFLWTLYPDSEFPNMGTVMMVVAAAVLATEFVDRLKAYRRIAAWITIGVAALYLVQLFRVFLDNEGELTTAVSTMFTEGFAIGPWIALAAGIVLLVREPDSAAD